jgi:hypothetical protein
MTYTLSVIARTYRFGSALNRVVLGDVLQFERRHGSGVKAVTERFSGRRWNDDGFTNVRRVMFRSQGAVDRDPLPTGFL